MENQDDQPEIISEEEMRMAHEFGEILENESLSSAVKIIQDYFAELDQVKLNIAVTGESGAGKSSFVNAIRGLHDDDEGAAPTDVVDTTIVPTCYPHLKYENVNIWDLPGIGNFKADEYLEKVQFENYDFFIIISSERFKSSHIQLAEEIQKRKKRFYLVRSKIDDSIRAAKRKKDFNQEDLLKWIRQDCIKGLEDHGLSSSTVFLISSHELGLYDFSLLEETMEKELPKHKRNVLRISLPNISLKIHQRKKEMLEANIWKFALLSCAVAVVPIPGLSICLNVAILVEEIRHYFRVFGLDEESLNNLAAQSGVRVEDLKACLKSPLSKEINADVIRKVLAMTPGAAAMLCAEFLTSAFPLLGSIPAGVISFATILSILKSCLKKLTNDAQNVLLRALQTEG